MSEVSITAEPATPKDGRVDSEGLGVTKSRFISLYARDAQTIEGEVVEETLACISINGQELASFMCSPSDLDLMAIGFLYNEGLISSIDDVRSIHIADNRSCVDIWLSHDHFEPPQRKIITAGCGGGVTFDDLSNQYEPLDSRTTASPDQLADLMRQTHLGAELYHRARGIHTAALADNNQLLMQVEDVGRHNCLDKLAGLALREDIHTKDLILFSSGRISSEMINKARRLQTPIVCSRTSPTSLSIALADAWNITLVAYLRQNRMRVYAHPERITGLD